MILKSNAGVLVVILATLAMPGVLAEEPEKEKPQPPRAEGERDPFSPSKRIQDEIQKKKPVEAEPQFRAAETPPSLPRLTLRGFAKVKEEPAVALLEVHGEGTYLVRAGDTISLNVSGRNTVLKVKDISSLSAFVEVGTLGQVIVVR